MCFPSESLQFQGPYSPTILNNIICFLPQDLAAFECNTTSDSLNRTIKPIRSCVTFKCCLANQKLCYIAAKYKCC